LASFTVDSDPPFDAGSAGSQVCTVTEYSLNSGFREE
jgi:hypothetical protein